jgi:hypothetical protein
MVVEQSSKDEARVGGWVRGWMVVAEGDDGV